MPTDAAKINPKTLDLVNRLLPGATPMGAYAMGMLCCAVWAVDPALEIPDTALAGATACNTMEQAERYASEGRSWATRLQPARNEPTPRPPV